MLCPTYHQPVMLNEAVDGLNVRPDGVYVDVTFGGGGHSREILSRLSDKGHLYSFDQDADAIQNAPEGDNRFTFVHSNFRFLNNWMRYYGIGQIDGLLADLGVSSHHFDDDARGFSFRFDAPLDMRMNQSGGRTAADIIASYDEDRLLSIMRLYGEVRQPQRIVRAIVRHREQGGITTTGQLAELVGEDKKELSRVFQALRIEVNGEMNALKQMLTTAQQLLSTSGRLVVLTYHSLEDRMVKNLIRSGNTEGQQQHDVFGLLQSPLRAIGKQQSPSIEEQNANPRSRSARLRIAEKR